MPAEPNPSSFLPAKGVREKETDLARDRESTTEQKGQYGCPGGDEGERTLASAGDRAVPWVHQRSRQGRSRSFIRE